MLHKAALASLIPLDLGGAHDADLEIEGLQLDLAAADLEALRQSLITDVAEIVASSDRIKLTPIHGSIAKPFLVAVAASLGYTIYIQDYAVSMAYWQCAGDELLEEPWAYFTAGCAMAGDYLAQEDPTLPWVWEVVVTAAPGAAPVPGLETVLNDLKPAELRLNFTYL